MRSRGFIIRFIDIGLLILFGFLMISDINATSHIEMKLPEKPLQISIERGLPAYLGISILDTDSFVIVDLEAEEILHQDILTAEELAFVLRTLQQQNAEEQRWLSVLIEPAPESSMQMLVDALDACERLGIQKRLNTATALVNPSE